MRGSFCKGNFEKKSAEILFLLYILTIMKAQHSLKLVYKKIFSICFEAI